MRFMTIGNMAGSLLGGRYSDYILRRLKEKNGGVSEAEVGSPAFILKLLAEHDCLIDEIEEYLVVFTLHCAIDSSLWVDE